ncbi:PD-(D/E)XK nuclease-like domain-containing protein [Nocardioides terrigena]|uniref:PD-(D/E)XK nuclease-like domain-containing protein n=1 Tax=Nocardioides terrigena TaxID=424797 RepID=UPI00131EFFA8|nr:PD-(D/E)XK nuclease-like domain-containing protein [Nocardioides terrigena]
MSGKPELVRDLDENTYHADTTSLSASGAKTLLGKRPPSPDADAMIFGRLVHTVILEPHKLDTYAVLDPDVIGVKANGDKADNPTATKAWKDAVFEAKRSGLTVIAPKMLAKARALDAAVRNHSEAGRLLAAATDHEVSAYADHPSGARVRARFDLVCPGAVVDVKTCRDADPESFGRSMNAFMYHVSAANYLDIARANGLKADRFDLICVEKEPTPGGDYRVSVLEIHPDAIDLGRELMAEACERWLALGKRIDLPNYGDGRHVIDLPAYAYPYESIELNLEGLAS